ncbi:MULTISPECIES: peptidase inhibitor family I36 protein [unclassified Streptomyces]|uniref:peptidase inhibitor family I36 protein n=1 Tax=unclassified Streptomyces TaxID=2593676 RepID=UPI003331D46F
MRSVRIGFAVTAAVGAVLITASSAGAATPSPSAPASGALGPAAEQQMNSEIAASKPVIATYKGKQINLAQGWQGAQVCAEVPSGEVKCFDSQAEADSSLVKENAAVAKKVNETRKALGQQAGQAPASTSSSWDCGSGWVCLWEHSDYSGRRLQWSAGGTKNLSNWSFRDQASSICVNRPQFGGTLIDFRDFQPDPSMSIPAGSCYDLTTLGYVHGGTWNDKADALSM